MLGPVEVKFWRRSERCITKSKVVVLGPDGACTEFWTTLIGDDWSMWKLFEVDSSSKWEVFWAWRWDSSLENEFLNIAPGPKSMKNRRNPRRKRIGTKWIGLTGTRTNDLRVFVLFLFLRFLVFQEKKVFSAKLTKDQNSWWKFMVREKWVDRKT